MSRDERRALAARLLAAWGRRPLGRALNSARPGEEALVRLDTGPGSLADAGADALLRAQLLAESAEQDSWRAFAVVTRLAKLLGVWEESWQARSMTEVGDMLCAALTTRLAAAAETTASAATLRWVLDAAAKAGQMVDLDLATGRLVPADTDAMLTAESPAEHRLPARPPPALAFRDLAGRWRRDADARTSCEQEAADEARACANDLDGLLDRLGLAGMRSEGDQR